MASHNKISIEEVKKRLFEVHGDIVSLKEETFIRMGEKACFVDVEYGEWSTRPSNVISGHGHKNRSLDKYKKTNLAKYGTEFPVRNKEIYKKHLRSCNNVATLFHWKTNEEILCKGSYENKTVKWLNNNKINYEWQPKAFLTPDNKEYNIDLYLNDQNLWVEIKGWLNRNETTKQKWLWFHENYPNSELWDRSKLKQLGVNVS